MRLNHVTVAVADIERSVRFYRTLGLESIVHSPHHARFVCPEGRSTLSVYLTAGPIASTTVVYLECDDVDAKVAALEAAGIRFESGPADRPWLWREARFADPDGNPLCLFRAGVARFDPPWPVAEPSRLA